MSTISSPIYHDIVLDTPGYLSPLTITATGTVSNSAAGYAVYGDTGTVINYGLISESGGSITDCGIYLTGAGSVTNSGTISSNGYGVFVASGGGVSNSGTIVGGRFGVVARNTLTITNTGTISGGNNAVILFGGGFVTNGGTISGPNGVGISGAAGTVVNTGSIAATYCTGISLAAGGNITNSATGIISSGGPYTGIYIGASPAIIVNYGTIAGYTGIAFSAVGTANQTVVVAGAITGSGGTAIVFAGGDDLLVLQAGYSLSGGIAGGAGTDTLELDGSGGTLTVNYNSLGMTNFEKVLFGAGNNATLKVSNTAGTVGLVISGFDSTTEKIDLISITNGTISNFDTATDRITVTGTGGSVTLQFDAIDGKIFTTAGDGSGGTNFSIACFCRGTLIRTKSGEVPVEQLVIGDKVMTASGAAKPIRWIGRRAYDGRFITGNPAVLPIRIKAGALADGVPTRDLLVSPEHAMVIDGFFLPARSLVNGTTIRQGGAVDTVEYFHLELEAHDVIFAEGAAAETFVDVGGRAMFHNAAEFAALYPEAATADWAAYSLLLKDGMTGLPAIRAALLTRAEQIGRVSRDPDLHLIVDGSVVRPQSAVDGVHRFTVQSGARHVTIASRTVVPAETEPESLDPRRLGVPLERIMLHGAGLQIVVDRDCVALCEGFHADEGSHRWTHGRGKLPPQLLACFIDDIAVEVRIGATELHYLVHELAAPTARPDQMPQPAALRDGATG